MPKIKQDIDDASLLRHVKALGLSTVQEYKDWCRSNGFSKNTNKTYKQRHDEFLHVSRKKADVALESHRKCRRPESIVLQNLDKFENYFGNDDVYRQLEFKSLNLPKIAGDIHKVLYHANIIGKLEVAKNFIRHLMTESDCAFEPLNSKLHNMIHVIQPIVNYEEHFIRPFETWKPRSHNVYKQFSSLIRHLFGKYNIPNFMDKVWFENFTVADQRQHKWFIHLGTGHNIRSAQELPVNLTKKQAHYFNQAPDNYTIPAAIRYGQILSLGGNVRLANALVTTRLCAYDSFVEDEFWLSVIRWFIANPMLDMVHVGPIIDWLYNQKYTVQHVFVRPGVAENRPPVQPNLSMHRRDANTTLREVNEWHRQLGRDKKNVNLQWASCGIRPFKFIEGVVGEKNMKIWTIRELLSGKELSDEGKKMHHCVGSYATSCHSGRVSIWAMELQTYEGLQKRLTLEVLNANKEIRQARGLYNVRANQQDNNIIARWCGASGLSINNFV